MITYRTGRHAARGYLYSYTTLLGASGRWHTILFNYPLPPWAHRRFA